MMKKQILKTVYCLSLSALMLLGEAGTVFAETKNAAMTETAPEEDAALEAEPGTDGAIDAVGAKIVAAYNLADVTGLAYNPQTNVLSWNKVSGADRYKVEVFDAAGASRGSYTTDGVYLDVEDMWSFTTDAAYTFHVTARNELEMYQVAANVSAMDLSGYEYDRSFDVLVGDAVLYNLYRHPASLNAAQLAAVVRSSAKTTAVSALAQIALKETTNEEAVFALSPSVIQPGERVEYDYANNPEFLSDGGTRYADLGNSTYTSTGNLGDISVPFSQFAAGDTIYIRARVYNPNYSLLPGQTAENRYSAYVSTTYAVPAADMRDVLAVVTNSSVRLEPSCFGAVTGFEYQRKNGKKWISLSCQGDAYTDQGLNGDTFYTYRVRGYIYNSITKKTSYTNWKSVNAYTWGSALQLDGAPAGASAVSLKWAKVPQAEGYEVYRVDTESYGYSMTKGEWEEAFANATLVKTIKKAKKPKYKDKKLTKGTSYTYYVRAYRTIKKTKCYIQEAITVSLAPEKGIYDTTGYYNANGSYTLNWQGMTGISGYKVEKKDPATGSYALFRNLGAKASSVTLPAVAAGSADESYKIRPYKGTRIYDTYSFSVEAKLPAVSNVKAVQTADGVQISWSAVPGADYYEVRRARRDAGMYDKTTKTYASVSGTYVEEANYTDTSAGLSFAPSNVYTNPNGSIGYVYSPALEAAFDDEEGIFCDAATAYSTTKIKGLSVLDKTYEAPGLILKSEDPAYNKAADPEYSVDAEDGYGYYNGMFGAYQKNADGSLKTRKTILTDGPEEGNEYYYFVRAVAEPANGANQNSESTYSVGYTKSARLVYTKVASPKDAKLSSAKSKKKASVTIKIKKAAGANGYAVYRSTKKGKGYVQVGTTTKTSYTDTNVVGGKTYFYKVAPYKKSENGTFIYYKQSAAKKVKAKK